jgi:antitoxin component YwqK of YwqJK toxin-antitoxin module
MGNYSNGFKDGEWKSYYDGTLSGTEIYINGVLKD